MACSPTPDGFARWTLRLLEERVVELNIVEKASDNTIGRTLKKHAPTAPQSAMGDPAGRQRGFRRGHGRRAGNLPKTTRSRSSSGLFGRNVQTVSCRDAQADPAKPGQPVRYDYEYARNGVADIFMMFAALEGWRKVKVTDHHAAVDYAQVLKELSDVHFPDAKQIVLVQDNLSTHTAASLYAAFPAEEARRLATRFERHSTPKHGSWLDMAESTRRSEQPMPGSPHSRQANPRKSDRRLGNTSKHASRQSRLAIHDQRRPRQTQEAIPPILSDSGH